MAEDLGDKTEAPSGRRLEEARARGQIAKSQDLAGAIDLAGAALAIILFGAVLSRGLAGVLRRALEDTLADATGATVSLLLRGVAIDAARAVLPILGLSLVIALAAHILQTGLNFTTTPLQLNFSRLNPITGLGRLFDRRQGVRTLTQIVKIIIAGAIGWAFMRQAAERVAGLPRLSLIGGAGVLGDMVLHLAIWLLALLLVLGAADYLFQRWQHLQDLRMTKEEVKDERRSMDGDPEVKARRLRLARQLALQRVSAAVPQADVVVTNPTHYSVAIRYDAATMAAPRVIAKGADFIALRIRQIAVAQGVPIVERPPLARALYAGVEVGQEVSPEFYQAIAEVLAYVYKLDRGQAA